MTAERIAVLAEIRDIIAERLEAEMGRQVPSVEAWGALDAILREVDDRIEATSNARAHGAYASVRAL
jgi:hypothetical protein